MFPDPISGSSRQGNSSAFNCFPKKILLYTRRAKISIYNQPSDLLEKKNVKKWLPKSINPDNFLILKYSYCIF